MAQSVEHVIGNDEVISSILITSSKTKGRGLQSASLCFRPDFVESDSRFCKCKISLIARRNDALKNSAIR